MAVSARRVEGLTVCVAAVVTVSVAPRLSSRDVGHRLAKAKVDVTMYARVWMRVAPRAVAVRVRDLAHGRRLVELE